ncbi:hypothetical protein [Streptomyces sp. URMC 124]|uniref:hypothetical protein n=1 Tax=Streptomyces sp. URMC 124 TaxID=3423405 RepID=UPI003F1D722A
MIASSATHTFTSVKVTSDTMEPGDVIAIGNVPFRVLDVTKVGRMKAVRFQSGELIYLHPAIRTLRRTSHPNPEHAPKPPALKAANSPAGATWPSTATKDDLKRSRPEPHLQQS